MEKRSLWQKITENERVAYALGMPSWKENIFRFFIGTVSLLAFGYWRWLENEYARYGGRQGYRLFLSTHKEQLHRQTAALLSDPRFVQAAVIVLIIFFIVSLILGYGVGTIEMIIVRFLKKPSKKKDRHN